MDLVITRSQIDRQSLAVVAALEALEEALGQAEVEQVGWAAVQPALAEVEVASYPLGGPAERLRQGLCSIEFFPAPQSNQVYIASRALDFAQRQEAEPPTTTSS